MYPAYLARHKTEPRAGDVEQWRLANQLAWRNGILLNLLYRLGYLSAEPGHRGFDSGHRPLSGTLFELDPQQYQMTAAQLMQATAHAVPDIVDPYVEEQLIAAFAGQGPLAEALLRQDRLEEALRELEAARHTLALYVSNTTLIETIGIEMFTKGAEEHQQRVELAELAFIEAREAQDASSAAIDGGLLRAWTGDELTPLERRTIVAKMVDRVILHPSKRPGKRSGKDIGERVQIVLRGNELLSPTRETANASLSDSG